MSTRPIKLGITGGIGTGKSHVCRLVAQHYGAPIYDTDTEARRLMLTDADLHAALSQIIGQPIIDESTGQLNRALISDFIRHQADGAQRVNALVHPCVRHDMLRWAAAQTTPFVIIECALLYESGFDADMDYSILITAPIALRTERVMARDGKSRDEVRHWMRLQMDEAEKQRHAHFVINNDSKADILAQFHDILATLHLA